MRNIDRLFKPFFESLMINNRRISNFMANDQYIISNSKTFLYNTIHYKNKVEQKPSFGIYYKDFDSMQAIVEVYSPASIIYWMYCQIYNRNRNTRGYRNYSFTIKISHKEIAEATGLSDKTISRYIADCVERNYVIPEENGEYSLNPRFCPWKNIYEVLTWNEEDIYQRTKDEPDGIKRKYMSKNCENMNDHDLPVIAKYHESTNTPYSPQPIDYIFDLIRMSANSSRIFPLSINLVLAHAESVSKEFGFKCPSRASIGRAMAEIMKTKLLSPQGMKDRCPTYKLTDTMSLRTSETIEGMKEAIRTVSAIPKEFAD